MIRKKNDTGALKIRGSKEMIINHMSVKGGNRGPLAEK